jgi:hypothetical protein
MNFLRICKSLRQIYRNESHTAIQLSQYPGQPAQVERYGADVLEIAVHHEPDKADQREQRRRYEIDCDDRQILGLDLYRKTNATHILTKIDSKKAFQVCLQRFSTSRLKS